MWKEIISRGFITYCIWGVCGLGILGKLLAHLGYAHYARVTGKIPETRNKLMKKMKMKFESCYKLNLGVNNIGLFVDKQLSKVRFLGIRLHRWERLPGNAMRLCLLLGCTGAFLCYYYGYPTQNITTYLIMGGGGILAVGAVSGLLDVEYKKNMVHMNVCEYLENYMANRLAHQYIEKKAVTGMEEETADDNMLIMDPNVETEIASMKRSLEQIAAGSSKRQEEMQKGMQAAQEEEVIQEILTEYLA